MAHDDICRCMGSGNALHSAHLVCKLKAGRSKPVGFREYMHEANGIDHTERLSAESELMSLSQEMLTGSRPSPDYLTEEESFDASAKKPLLAARLHVEAFMTNAGTHTTSDLHLAAEVLSNSATLSFAFQKLQSWIVVRLDLL